MTFSIHDEIALLADNFSHSYPHEIIAWTRHRFGDGLVMATGFGPEGIVILHIVQQAAPGTPVFYLDTDLLFPETYQLRDRLEAHFGIRFTRVTASLARRRKIITGLSIKISLRKAFL